MNIVNLTPHTINIINGDKNVAIAPSGNIARVASSTEQVGEVEVAGMIIPVTVSKFGDVVGLPEPTEGTIFVVSGMVAGQVSREDVFSPGEQVRNDAGQVIGCKTLSRSC